QNPARGRWFGLIVPRFEEGLWENSQYVLDKQMAETEGVPGLPLLIQTIREKLRPRKLNIIAHSMGAWLVLQALEKHAAEILPIDRLIFLAPDVPANAFSNAALRTAAAQIGSVHVYHSRLDDILALTEIGWKEMSMGRLGPYKKEALHANIKVHNVTEALGKENVHGKYLKENGAEAIALTEALR
ncbi:MAG: alpha/beta hydrolase, partial [Hyphomicrobiaceae bacterium]